MDSSKASPREYLRQAIDAEIEESTREALRHRRNALAPASSLLTEVITAIFSLLSLPGTPQLCEKPAHHLAWLHVTHVCLSSIARDRTRSTPLLDQPNFGRHG
jgi:hypothetical protein